MEWWLGDEWRQASLDTQERHLRSATQWANQRVKRARHRLVDEDILRSRLNHLLQMTSNSSNLASRPQFRGSARDWAAHLGAMGVQPQHLTASYQQQPPSHAHSLQCGHTPVKILSTEGTTSLGFVVNRANCCAVSGNLLCDVHNGKRSESGEHHHHDDEGNPTPIGISTVAHGDHIDFVIDGHLAHPTEEKTSDGQYKWRDCGELVELDQETIADMYAILI